MIDNNAILKTGWALKTVEEEAKDISCGYRNKTLHSHPGVIARSQIAINEVRGRAKINPVMFANRPSHYHSKLNGSQVLPSRAMYIDVKHKTPFRCMHEKNFFK